MTGNEYRREGSAPALVLNDTVPSRRLDATPTTTESRAGSPTTVLGPAVTATRNGPL